jgi:hypothetical protein
MNTAFLGAVVTVVLVWLILRSRAKDDGSTDLEILGVDFEPASGAVLTAGERVVATINYRYSKPRSRLFVWAKADHPDSSYEPSNAAMQPGTGSINRYVELGEAGRIESISILVRDAKQRTLAEHVVAVDYEFLPDPERERLREDGIGSKVTAVRFDPPSGTPLKVGQQVVVEVDYEITGEKGLNLWVVPVTTSRASYEPSEKGLNGVGSAKRWFVLGEATDVEHVMIVMTNYAGETIVEDVVDVDYRVS